MQKINHAQLITSSTDNTAFMFLQLCLENTHFHFLPISKNTVLTFTKLQ